MREAQSGECQKHGYGARLCRDVSAFTFCFEESTCLVLRHFHRTKDTRSTKYVAVRCVSVSTHTAHLAMCCLQEQTNRWRRRRCHDFRSVIIYSMRNKLAAFPTAATRISIYNANCVVKCKEKEARASAREAITCRREQGRDS
jgi:hypothetical protein